MVNGTSVDLTELADKAAKFRASSRAPSTQKAYAKDYRLFSAWCAAHDLVAMPATPITVSLYLAAQAGKLSAATLERRIAALVITHRQMGHELDGGAPVIDDTLAGIRREIVTPRRVKAPMTLVELEPILAALPTTLAGARDRAILALGQAGGFRRCEIVGLDHSSLNFMSGGIIVRVSKGKTSSEAEPSLKGIPRGATPASCPVAALVDWLGRSGIEDGPLFRPIDRFGRIADERLVGRAVLRIVKRAALSAAKAGGLPRAKALEWAQRFGAASLRSGYITGAAAAGGEEWAIQLQTGHKRRQTMLRYLRPRSALNVARIAQAGAAANRGKSGGDQVEGGD